MRYLSKIILLIFSMVALGLYLSSCTETEEEIPGEPPTADAGIDVNAVVNSTVQLSGSASDPDGDQLTTSWTVTSSPSGSTASVNNASSLNATFTPDVAGNYTLQLSVDDGNHPAVTDEMIITAEESIGDPPNAILFAENNQVISEDNENNTVTIGTPFLLNASFTTDPDTEFDDLTFEWEITATPDGSTEASITPDASNPDEATFVPDLVGVYTITLTVTDPEGNVDTETAEIIADANPVVKEEDIDDETTWPNVFEDPELPDYLVVADISIAESLTIMPGVKILIEPNHRITVGGDNGALIAQGKADSLIVFTAEDSVNGWQGIIVYNNNALNEMDYVEMSYGGNRDATSGVEPANLGLEGFGDARMKISNSKFLSSFGDGLYIEDGATIPNFANNVFEDNTNHPITLSAMHVGSLDEMSTYTNNGNNTVQIEPTTVDFNDEQVWPALANDVSYYSTGRILIESGLKIAEGSSFIFNADGFIQLNGDGYLQIEGTESNNVDFTAEVQENGWGGFIIFSNDNRNSIAYTNISYAGNRNETSGVKPSALGLEGFSQSKMKLTNTTISNSMRDYGLYVEDGATLGEFTENSFMDNESYPIGIHITAAGILDAASTFTNNGNNMVEIFDSNLEDAVTLPTFTDGTAYYVSGRLDIDADLTIEGGASFEMAKDVLLEVGGDGSLNAVGTMDNEITFTANNTNDGWAGLLFFSNKSSNELAYCNFSYGGNRNAVSGVEPANVGLEAFSDSKVEIVNCDFTDSFGFGLYIEGDAVATDDSGTAYTNQTELEAGGNTFSNNTSGPSNL